MANMESVLLWYAASSAFGFLRAPRYAALHLMKMIKLSISKNGGNARELVESAFRNQRIPYSIIGPNESGRSSSKTLLVGLRVRLLQLFLTLLWIS